MNKDENKIWLKEYILNNPFDFKQGIINHCRQMDKIDVYEWVAEDELKIQQLQQRIDKIIEYLDNLSFDGYCDGEYVIRDLFRILEGDNNE